MSQFKRFNASEHGQWSGNTLPAGTLTWDPDNGLRLHDGNNSNPVGGSSNYYDLNNRPYGSTAVSDLMGGSSSDDNGKFLQQYATGQSGWSFPDRVDTANNAITLADQESTGWNDRSGMIVVTDHYHGYTYTWIVGGGAVVLLGGTNGSNPATCTLTFNGSYTLTNTSGTSRNFGIAWVITRHGT